MPHTRHSNTSFANLFEKDAIVAATKSKPGHGRLQPFDITTAGSKITVGAAQEVKRREPIDGA
jgi:hypothetical protein